MLNELIAALSTENYVTGLGHAPRDGKNLFLSNLHLAQSNRTLGLEVVAQHLRSTL
jgi:hypothetical protein